MEKFILVTGACINTGVAIVEKFAETGNNVIFTGRDEAKVKEAELNYRAKFPNVKIIGFVANALKNGIEINKQDIDNIFKFVDDNRYFISDVILNAADQGLGQAIWKNPLTDYMQVINTNVIWNYYISELASFRMKDNGGGSILFINSNTAYRAIPNRISYETSKGAQLGMMRGLAFDLGKYNIRVNAILPGMIKTDRWVKNPDFYATVPSRFTPLGDVAVGSDIADACYYFVFMARNTTGAELVIDGGNTIQLYPIVPKDE